jgi:hypothetical protein
MTTYPDSLTLAEARSQFFARSGLGNDGGYNARWVRVETKPFPVFFPNTACRVEAAKLHDLHHIALEYRTDWAGEVEIAGWEIASGCGRHGWAWLLNLGSFTIGLFLFPKRLYAAFMRGRRARNLYRTGFAEADLATHSVGWLRDWLRAEQNARETLADKTAFATWSMIGIMYHAACLVAALVCLYALVKTLL